MTSQIDEEDANTESGMSEHLQRYRKYIDSLKEGRSSGISSVFGRASDLLPPDVLEIKPPSAVAESFPANLVSDTEENGFEDDGPYETNYAEPYDADSDLENENHGAVDHPISSDVLESENVGEDEQDFDEVGDEDEPAESDDTDLEEDDDLDEDDDDFEEQDEDETEQLTVKSAQGAVLWTIYFNRVEPLSITMADGSSIKNAEGRDDTVLALKTNASEFKFFILSGLVIDPVTGNIYVEANDGAFTAAFMNNGWQIQQYRNHEGEETYYATEPFKPGRDRLTMQITNVSLDPVHGEVSYDSLDGSASMTLKSRKLLRTAES